MSISSEIVKRIKSMFSDVNVYEDVVNIDRGTYIITVRNTDRYGYLYNVGIDDGDIRAYYFTNEDELMGWLSKVDLHIQDKKSEIKAPRGYLSERISEDDRGRIGEYIIRKLEMEGHIKYIDGEYIMDVEELTERGNCSEVIIEALEQCMDKYVDFVS